MVSRQHKLRHRVLSSVEAAGVLENGDGGGGGGREGERARAKTRKSVNQYARQSEMGIGRGGRGSAAEYRGDAGGGINSKVSMCEMVRRTFSGTGLTGSDADDVVDDYNNGIGGEEGDGSDADFCGGSDGGTSQRRPLLRSSQ